MNPCEFELLCYVLAEIEAFSAMDHRLLVTNHRFAKEMCEVGIPFRPSHWKSGSITSAQRMAYSRAVRRLEHANSLLRVTESHRDRTTHVKPTKQAIDALINKLGDQVNEKDLIAGLSRMKWGQSLAKSLTR